MLVWIEYLRALAILMVVALHVFASVLQKYPNVDLVPWTTANIIASFSRVCVPIFFLISGYLSFFKYENWKLFYKKRLISVVVPFGFWWLVYYLLEGNLDKYHFWYMWVTLPIFLLVPVLYKIKNIKYILTIITIGFFWKYTAYISYFLLGNYLVGLQVKGRKSLLVAYLVASFATAWITRNHVFALSWFDEKYYQYYSPLVVLAGVSLFLFFKDRELKENWLVQKISKHSFSIYLSHLLVLERTYFMPPVLQYVATIAISLVVSMFADRIILWIQTKLLH